MEKEEKNPKTKEHPSGIQQHEDVVLKTSMQFFAEELLPYLNIQGKVVSFAPTELVHLELQKLFQDFNLVMEDGTWKHFEFQSTNEGIKGLKRFRVYEAVTSYQHDVTVETYVLFSGSIENPMTEFTEGCNTYRIKPIILKHKDADKLLAKLEEKHKNEEAITKEDLVPLVLCPLMGGKISQKDRIHKAYEIIRNATEIEKEESDKLEAMLYAMADKFLEKIDLEKLKEEIAMTRLGQMIWEDGLVEGEARGEARGVAIGEARGKVISDITLICKKMLKGQSIEMIADTLEQPIENIVKIYDVAKKFAPDYDVNEIYNALQESGK